MHIFSAYLRNHNFDLEELQKYTQVHLNQEKKGIGTNRGKGFKNLEIII